MKKILVFVQPTLNASGSERSMIQILKGFQADRADHEVVVLSGENGVLREEVEKLAILRFANFKKIRRNFASIKHFASSIKNLYDVFISYKNYYDKVQVYVNTMMLPQAVIASKLARCTCIVHIREVETTYPKFIYNAYYLISAACANKMISVCNYINNQFWVSVFSRSLSNTPQVVYNSSDYPFNGERKTRSNLITILAVMPFTQKKGGEDLVNFAIMLSDTEHQRRFRIVVAGKIDDQSFYESQMAKLESRGCRESILFAGELSSDGLAEMYKSASFFLLTSHTEAFPRVLVEAMNFGLPCIATRVGGVPEIVEGDINGYIVDVGDVEAMVNYASVFISNPNHLSAMQINAQEYFGKNYTRAIMYRKVSDLINCNWK